MHPRGGIILLFWHSQGREGVPLAPHHLQLRQRQPLLSGWSLFHLLPLSVLWDASKLNWPINKSSHFCQPVTLGPRKREDHYRHQFKLQTEPNNFHRETGRVRWCMGPKFELVTWLSVAASLLLCWPHSFSSVTVSSQFILGLYQIISQRGEKK